MDWTEAERLMESLRRDRDWRGAMLVSCGCYLGLRISDILPLRWHQILDGGVLEVTEQKTGKHRQMRINAELERTAEECFRMMREEEGMAGRDDYIFYGRGYGPWTHITRQRADQLLKAMKSRYGIKTAGVFSTHTLRKTFGRRVYFKAIEDGKSGDYALELLQEVFGHKNIWTTRRYLGIRKDEILSVYDNL